jgi:hypothetical protein
MKRRKQELGIMGIRKLPTEVMGKFPNIPSSQNPSQVPSLRSGNPSQTHSRHSGFNIKQIFLIVIVGILLLDKCEVVHGQNGIEENSLFDFSNNEIVDNFGLTAYGEPCTDECSNRGFSYAWCHKTPSRNGTWVDRDYCSQNPGYTRYGEKCLDGCSRKKNQPFFTCPTKLTKRGDWDYCSPFEADLICEWSQWGPWSQCSNQCGTKSTKTRRRRLEQKGTDGRVGRCSGEIEQSIKSCPGTPCPGRTHFLLKIYNRPVVLVV